MKRQAIGFLIALALPSATPAQDYPSADPSGGTTILRGPRRDVAAYAGTPPVYGPGHWHYTGWPHGPRTAPPWSYYGLAGGPFIDYPWGSPGYPARAGAFRSHGLSLHGPRVPVYGPVPSIVGNDHHGRLGKVVPSPGLPFGWVGMFAASPRPRPPSVGVWANPEPSVPATGRPGYPTGCLVLSVKVPLAGAEVFVDGVKTAQTGTDRVFESPPLESGKEFRYELTARWVEQGVTREAKRVVTGTPGEVLRVDFTAPEVVPTAGK
jgi:uncharacterized protein (TIGR03000 family)